MKRLLVVLLVVALLSVSCTDPVATDLSSQTSNESTGSEDVASQDTSSMDYSSQEPSQSETSSETSPQDTNSESEVEILLADGEYYNGLNDKFIDTDAESVIDEPKVTVINSVDALQNYYYENKDLYNLEEFKTEITEFDEKYFEEKTVILVAFGAGETCTRYAVNSIEQKDGKLNVSVAHIYNGYPTEFQKIVRKTVHAIIKLDKTQLSTDKINIEKIYARETSQEDAVITIDDLQEERFTGNEYDTRCIAWAKISHDYCIGDVVKITFKGAYQCLGEDGRQWIYCTPISVEPAELRPNTATGKPVIYIYPTEKTDVTVKLDFNGRLGYTYPKYDGLWKVTAYPDGKLVDEEGRRYNTLFWDGWSDVRYDLSKGFCIKGEDTEEFLREKLAFLGLNEAETEEFLEYWLKWMEGNNYNIITFQDELYKETAKLTICPEPDTVIRVFMAFTPSEEFVELEPQILTPAERSGYTVVEWGGTMQ